MLKLSRNEMDDICRALRAMMATYDHSDDNRKHWAKLWEKVMGQIETQDSDEN